MINVVNLTHFYGQQEPGLTPVWALHQSSLDYFLTILGGFNKDLPIFFDKY